MNYDDMINDPNFGTGNVTVPPAADDTQQPPATETATSGHLSDTPIMKSTWMPGWVRNVVKAAEAPVGQSVVPGPPAVGHEAAAGFTQGVQDVFNKPTNWALQGAAKVGITDQSTADQVKAAADQREADFNKQFGDSTAAKVGRVAGQVVASAPAMSAAGGALSMAGRVAPAIAPITDFVGGVAGGSTGGLPGMGLRALSRAVQGGWTGGLQSELSGQDVGSGAATGAIAGPIAGALLDPLVSRLQRLAGSRIGPVGAEIPDEVAAKARQAQILTNHGVSLNTSQVSPDPLRLEATKIFEGGTEFPDQLQQFRGAAMQKAGMPGTIADDTTIGANDLRIGNGMDTIVNRNPFHYNTIEPGLSNIEANLGSSNLNVGDQQIIKSRLNDVLNRASGNNGVIDGQTYRALTDSNSDLAGLISDADNNPNLAKVAGQVRDTIRNGFQSVASPQDQAALTALEQQYRATRAIETASGSDGTFTPQKLYQATERQGRNFGGTGTLDDLAAAGNSILQPGGKSPYSKWGGGLGLLGSVTGGVAGGEMIADQLAKIPEYLQHPGLLLSVAAPALTARGLSRWAERSPTQVQQAINTATGGNRPLDLRGALQLLTQTGGAQPAPF